MSSTDPKVVAVMDGLRNSRKYHSLCADTLNRIAAWAVTRHPREKEAIKAAKRKLHQVYGAYLQGLDLREIERTVEGLSPEADETAVRAACRKVLAAHTSSAERLPFIDRVYQDLFDRTGPPESVLDIACGLNPLSLPWMGLPKGVRYRAVDIDESLIEITNRFLACVRPSSSAECRDVLADSAPLTADVVLLLKSIPCLEQQHAGAARNILSRIRARWTVISFPNQSLGGADRGMPGHYADLVSRLCTETGYESIAIPYPTESFYLLRRPCPPSMNRIPAGGV